MARKNPFEHVMSEQSVVSGVVKTNFKACGASKSISSTLDDLADKADKLLEGETIVDLDPKLIDPSFLKDRIEYNDDEFEKLKSAIKADGQNSPILVRPHPDVNGRYMVVFGARRKRVAEELGLLVRAVIKDMTNRDHVVAQGQENAARSNLTFIERALMAVRLIDQKYDKDNTTAMVALSIDKATLSKMLSVAGIPEPILNSLGAARLAGRDRWYELKMLLDRPQNFKKAIALLDEERFQVLDTDLRFGLLYQTLKNGKKVSKGKALNYSTWISSDKKLEINTSLRGKKVTLILNFKDQKGREFGEFISKQFEELYEQFRAGTRK